MASWAVAGDSVFIPLVGEERLAVLDRSTFGFVGSVPLRGHPVYAVRSPSERELWVSFSGEEDDSFIDVVDVETLRVKQSIEVGRRVYHFDFTPRGTYVVATANGAERLVLIDAATYRVVDEQALRSPSGVFGVWRAFRLGRKLHVGKRSGHHCVPQREINALLIALAGEGLDVVRLKGGDPFVFGRGGEELLALAAASVPFEVVPGVSAGTAATGSAFIPVTHRAVARSVTFFTAHTAVGGEVAIDYDALARIGGTLVAFMGLSRLGDVASALIAAGLDPDLPAAVVSESTTPRQRVVTSTASLISEDAARAGVTTPALVVFGHVVRFPVWLREVEGLARASPAPAF